MKKIFSMLLLCVIFSSCNNSDNETPLVIDPIIGVWQLTGGYNISPAGVYTQAILNDCSLLTTKEFTEDGLFILNSHGTNPPFLEACFENTFNGIWTDEGDNYYSYAYPNQAPTYITTVFTDNNNTMEVFFTSAGYVVGSFWHKQ